MCAVASKTKGSGSTAGRQNLTWLDRLDVTVVLSSIRVALRLNPFVPVLADALSDGVWAGAWPVVAAVVPLLAFAVGLFGVGHWPGIFDRFYITSLSFMIVAIAGAILSGTAGVTFLAGYIIGDILGNPFVRRAGWSSFGNTPMSFRIHETVALRDLRILGLLLISYMVLALLVIVVPQVSRRMAEDVANRVRAGSAFRLFTWIGLYVAACGFFTYLWAHAAVLLIRPVFTFRGSPSVSRQFQVPLFTNWQWLVAAAVLAAAIRVALEHLSQHSPRGLIIARSQRARAHTPGRGAFWATLPQPIPIALTSIVTAFLLSGVVAGWSEFLIVVLSVALIQIWRSILSSYVAWTRIVTAVPFALRFVVGFFVGSWFARTSMSYVPHSWHISFRAILLGALLMLAVFGVLFPSQIGSAERKEVRA